MSSPTLLVQKHGRVSWLTLNRPASLNALDEELVHSLTQAADAASRDNEVRAVAIAGSGGNFCSGLDLKSAVPDALTREQAQEKLRSFQGVIEAITSSPKPFIACVEGAAVGFGADLALCCDLRVFAQGAYLQEKFVDIGLMPDGGGTFWLPRLVGLGRALEIMMLGERVGAERAEALGLATLVVPNDELHERCQKLAERLCDKAPLALGAIKAATRASLEGSLAAALEREKAGQSALLTSRDFREGVRAWSERRPPQFSGQ